MDNDTLVLSKYKQNGKKMTDDEMNEISKHEANAETNLDKLSLSMNMTTYEFILNWYKNENGFQNKALDKLSKMIKVPKSKALDNLPTLLMSKSYYDMQKPYLNKLKNLIARYKHDFGLAKTKQLFSSGKLQSFMK